MKRLLALILALLLCVGLFASCNEEEQSSSNSSSSSSSSSSEEQGLNEQVNFEYLVENSYRYYTFNSYGVNFYGEVVNDAEQERGYKLWLLKDFEEYNEFFNRATRDLDYLFGTPDIFDEVKKTTPKESDFDDHFVVALYLRANAPLRFGKLAPSGVKENKYFMVAETQSAFGEAITPALPPNNIYFVLVPKTELRWYEEIDSIDVVFYKHICDKTKTPFEYFDVCEYITED